MQLHQLLIELWSYSTANVCQVEDCRLEHLGQGSMAKIVQTQFATGVDFKPGQKQFCDARVSSVGNLSMAHFASKATSRAHSFGSLWPLRPVCLGRIKLVCFVYCWQAHFAMIYLMKRKSDVFEKLQEYETFDTAHFGLNISKLIVD